MTARWLTIFIALGLAASTAAQAEKMLIPGRYDVEIDLQLPNLADAGAKKRASICVTGDAHRGLSVLSGNNPLAKCPITNVKEEGARLTFDIICPGGNSAKARAMYTLGPEAFHGRIEMNMGGKNMTMAEVQEGLRNGDCVSP